ncbi:acyltransferase [Puia sp.]|jgi:peptidoglycan/LPS O-acetylase OafA/YrhL|uniref:acyltransferase family protein n=1 Tax=Puia sp. TaxID=2045100 RepID=UPI002F42A87E
MNSQQQHFRKIDFLRGIAILAVFQAHFIWYYFPAYPGLIGLDSGLPVKKVVLLSFLPRTIGWSGVTIFLLVSGFLLHLGYLRSPSTFTLRGFYSRRFWRVYPPYLLVLLVFCLFLEKDLFNSLEGWKTFLFHVLSAQNLSTRTYFSVNPTFWCLALEVQLYLLYAVFLYGRRKWGVKRMTGLTLLVSIVWQAVGMRVDGLANSLPWANAAISIWVVWATGAFLAEAYHEGRRIGKALDGRDRLFIAGGFVLAIVLTPLNAVLQYTAGLTGVLLMDLFLHSGKMTLQRWPARVIVTIGLCSFSVFLIHQPLLQAWIDFLDRHSPVYRGYRLVDGLLVSLGIFLLSYAMYHFVELPSIRIGNRLRKERKPALTV